VLWPKGGWGESLSSPFFLSFLPSATREPVHKLVFGLRSKRSISFPEPALFRSAMTEEGQVRSGSVSESGVWMAALYDGDL